MPSTDSSEDPTRESPVAHLPLRARAGNVLEMEIIPDKRKVVGLVEQAYEGKICLPNFQRDFVWTREGVADLVRSIVRQYFIGSLLLLRSDPAKPPFAPMFLRGARSPFQEPRPEYLILDGQQRISSLIYALTAPNLSLKDSSQRRWFFLDLDALLDDPDSDSIVFDRAKRELGGLDARTTQFEQRVLPCTELLSADKFYKWRDEYEDWLRANTPNSVDEYRSIRRDGWTKAVTAFQTFEVALIELPQVDDADNESIGRVCAIFEKLNSTGVDLSVYDLLTARLYRSGIRLHQLWDGACARHTRLRAWSGGKADTHKFGVLALRTLALLRGLDPKPRVLINLDPNEFERDWYRAVAAVEKALQLITHIGQDGFGVFDRKWLPGFGLVPILAALRAQIDDHKLGERSRADLRRWYWCNVFLERYSSAVESKSRKDYIEMTRHWFDSGPEPEVFREAQDRIGTAGFRIRTSASYASAVYSGVFCLLALRSARDWRRGESIQLQDLQDHHIFPQAYLKRHGIIKRTAVNTIANRTLISDETNGKIKDRAPAGYISDTSIVPADNRAELLRPHFLDDPAIAMMEAADEGVHNADIDAIFERFSKAREGAMIDEIRRVCGIAMTDLATTELGPEDEVAPDVAAREEIEDSVID